MSLSKISKKISPQTLGYILLIVGLIMIIGAVYSMYNVYTGAKPAPSVIHVNSTIAVPAGTGALTITDFIPGPDLNWLINTVMWFVLMIFIVLAGGKIGDLGVQLIRTMKVESEK
ncbi:MAG: hypothetical protein OI715_00920 (plasmid) [Candidatus Methanoperedens sp.]|nr:MAG: hypothetical protein OI715_00920 [Candidatus Methanoperedens sp.]